MAPSGWQQDYPVLRGCALAALGTAVSAVLAGNLVILLFLGVLPWWAFAVLYVAGTVACGRVVGWLARP